MRGPSMPVSAPEPVVFPSNSSFTYDNYYQAQNFFRFLAIHYPFTLAGLDVGRFYRNREPLMTPLLLRQTLAKSMAVSNDMISSIDALQAMLADLEAGKTVDRAEMQIRTRQIREWARQIRQNESVSFFDQRKERDMTKGLDSLGLKAISQLREMAVALNSQLRTLCNQTDTSTVSLGNLSQPSFQSLSKGIEKLSKIIENAAPRS